MIGISLRYIPPGMRASIIFTRFDKKPTMAYIGVIIGLILLFLLILAMWRFLTELAEG